MNIFKRFSGLDKVRLIGTTLFRCDSVIHRRLATYVSRHSIECRLEVYTIGYGGFRRGAMPKAHLGPSSVKR
jgi:IS4 transposase